MNNFKKEVAAIKLIRETLFACGKHPNDQLLFALKEMQVRLELENLQYGLHIVDRTTAGIKLSFAHAWLGIHWCKFNKRVCITLIPFVTIWIAFKGGFRPREFKLT